MLLISYFEPFGRDPLNSTEVICEEIKRVRRDVQFVKLPTVFYESGTVLTSLIKEVNPDTVIMLGQAGGRAAITPEMVALNWIDARIKDNRGQKPIDKKIVEGGPAAYFSTLPVRKIVEALTKGGIPARVSYSAGTFVCNALFYQVMHFIIENRYQIKAGFVHFPYLSGQVLYREEAPSLDLAKSIEGLNLIIELMEGSL
ncbi:pyrrolidone-carboxylate peptidase [Kosmotoga arenicorallina S304]|uniref:Pyroglutamyl-peptidase I n=1 Tax=Kosmotoga arenicorallina S304 TaxID=1453497 RepID=A0A176K3X1_9BACT|nr:pyroglutamyl-peptidase I [Kosmotoga arenicorallina]OAA31712.1 pyrrolidone-carboxylate peptidase [Kosmotoga arenicorallina S304]